MRIALGHDRRLMSQEPLYLVEVYSGLHHSCGERMAKIMKMEIVDLCTLKRRGQRSADVAPIKGSLAFAVEHEINRPWPRRVFLFQEIKDGGVDRDRPSFPVF